MFCCNSLPKCHDKHIGEPTRITRRCLLNVTYDDNWCISWSHTLEFLQHIYFTLPSLSLSPPQPSDGRISIKKTTWAFLLLLLLLTLNYDAVPRSAITLQRERPNLCFLSLYILRWRCIHASAPGWTLGKMYIWRWVKLQANQSRSLRMTHREYTKYGMCQHFGTWPKGKRLGYWLRPFYAKL